MAEEHAEVQSTQPAAAHKAHKSPNYIVIFVWLIVITAAEVAVGSIPPALIPNTITFPILLVMAGAKALLVALYFMHLRYDSPWYTMHMLAALPLAVLFILALVLGFSRR